ncbi:hypothetical protein [Stutzerimonas nitrititolerans]|uniref:hypothetical protein n=1 Tax=Stutzerimonas nitrititolerans TaxID=2482751 RepID=UPI0028AEC28E|nr:hypothetical protein [Stutzerimonas nitrititolerans]
MSSKIAVRTVEILTPENAPFNLKSVCEAIHSAVAPLTGSPVMVTVDPEPRIVKGGLPDAEGHVGPQQGQGEPVAWSTSKPTAVGAFWVRGNGLDQDALVQVIDDGGELRCNLHRPTTETDFGYGYAIADLNGDFEWLGPLYTRADPDETEWSAMQQRLGDQNETLRAQLVEAREDRNKIGDLYDEAERKLAEAHALLVKANYVIDHARTIDKQAFARGTQNVDHGLFRGLGNLLAQYDEALSASAEPSAPKLSEPVIPGHRLEALEALIADGDPHSDANVSNLNVAELISAVRTLQVRSIFVEPSAPVEIDERSELEAYCAKVGLPLDRLPSGEYLIPSTRFVSQGWHAHARGALERNPCDLADVFDLESAAWMLRKHCHEELAGAVERASAALKQRPSRGGAR